MNARSDLQILIPAAGYGTRVGKPESKEMLLSTDGKRLIDFSLELALKHQVHAHVITRPEKQGLIQYLQKRSQMQSMSIQLIQPQGEWPRTLIQSQAVWKDKNIVLLPDTVWQPQDALSLLFEKLNDFDASYAVFKEENLKTWGAVSNLGSFQICEKPERSLENFFAWGFFGFRKRFGELILEAHQNSTEDHLIKSLDLRADFVHLENFKDLTREVSVK